MITPAGLLDVDLILHEEGTTSQRGNGKRATKSINNQTKRSLSYAKPKEITERPLGSSPGPLARPVSFLGSDIPIRCNSAAQRVSLGTLSHGDTQANMQPRLHAGASSPYPAFPHAQTSLGPVPCRAQISLLFHGDAMAGARHFERAMVPDVNT